MAVSELQTDQYPDAAPPCGKPTGFMKPGMPDFLCQRGAGHPGHCETMTRDGDQLEWGYSQDFPEDDG